jgi:hypothetical protein
MLHEGIAKKDVTNETLLFGGKHGGPPIYREGKKYLSNQHMPDFS